MPMKSDHIQDKWFLFKNNKRSSLLKSCKLIESYREWYSTIFRAGDLFKISMSL